MAQNRQSRYRINDKVISQIAMAYSQAESILDFVAPTVPVTSRSGLIVQFDETYFSLESTVRTPYSKIKRQKPGEYRVSRFYLQQHLKAAEVAIEEVEEAAEGDFNIDLTEMAVIQTVEKIANSIELELITLITDSANFDASLSVTLIPAEQWDATGSNPRGNVAAWKEAVRGCIGRYPNRMVIGADVYLALLENEQIQESIKFVTTQQPDLDLLAQYFGLPGGIRISQRVIWNEATGKFEDIWPAGTVLLFYSPDDPVQLGPLTDDKSTPIFDFKPGINRSIGAFAYTYALADGIKVSTERFDDDTRTLVRDVEWEGAVVLPFVNRQQQAVAGFIASGVV